MSRSHIIPSLEQSNPEKIEVIEMSAYRHGVKVEQVLEVFGIVLRDKLFEKLNIPKDPSS